MRSNLFLLVSRDSIPNNLSLALYGRSTEDLRPQLIEINENKIRKISIFEGLFLGLRDNSGIPAGENGDKKVTGRNGESPFPAEFYSLLR